MTTKMPGELHRIPNFVPISDAVGTAGQPTVEQIADIGAAGFQVVINLAMSTSSHALSDEAALVTARGMEYVHIPVVWESPTLKDLDRFLQAMDRHQGSRIFVHCALNMRVSVFVLLYRVIRQGVPLDLARESMHQIWEPNAVWQAFLSSALATYGVPQPGSAGATPPERRHKP